jgi:hypothetical protein
MKSSALIILFILSASILSFSQKVSGRLTFQQGQIICITVEVKSTVSQQAMGNAIDFNVDGAANHSYKVTNATDDNNTLHHDVKKIRFSFEGMGTKRSFDSDNKNDMSGMFGLQVKDILSKSFDMIIDPSGKVLMVKPEKIELAKGDDRLAIVFSMLKDITSIVHPPKKKEASLFKVLPDTATGLHGSWNETGMDANGKFSNIYTLSAITDSTIVIDLKGNSVTTNKAEVMNIQISTTMNNDYTGKIILDKSTGILKEKTITTISTGTAEGMGGTTPVSSKTTITIHTRPSS